MGQPEKTVSGMKNALVLFSGAIKVTASNFILFAVDFWMSFFTTHDEKAIPI